MKHRVFIAINLPEEVKKKLADYQEKWRDLLPIRWVKKENLHITLAFLGYLDDEEIVEVCKITKEVAEKHQSFSVNLNKICYGPPKKMPPRMIWVMGERSEEFAALRNDLEKSLLSLGRVRPAFSQKGRKREFSPHITLGRIRVLEWRRIEPEEREDISEDISFNFEVQTIEAMESHLKRGGPEYRILESAPLRV